ncbi:MAG TPA: glycosyltransferase family 4 protein [Anaerolineales bacterium]|nr:glycosyltransferase family 4 protein [Anaerolineales bacterium]
MRLLVINSEYPPVGAGAGKASASISERLAASGHEVLVLTAGFSGLPADERLGGVRVLRGPVSRRRVDRSTAFEQVLFMLGSSVRCLGLVRDFRPDVVLAFFGLPSGGVAWFLKLIFGTPYVVSLRGGDVPGFRPYDFWLYHRLAIPFLRIVWHGAEQVVANSEGLRSLARGFDANVNVAVIPNGVDPKPFRNSDRSWSDPRILSVGRIVHQKGLDLALSALGPLRDLPWEWKIAGDGPQLKPLQQRALREGLAARVHWIGWKSSQALIREYQEASLFLFPSRHEGMPNAVLEAMASGLPVIATRIAGNEELVVPGETGLLVPPGDAQALQDALRSLLQDGTARERMGRAGQARVSHAYSWTTVSRQYEHLLQKAIR